MKEPERGRDIIQVVITFVASVKQSDVLMKGTRWPELRSWSEASVASIWTVITPQANGCQIVTRIMV
jgi:hypothetical protein